MHIYMKIYHIYSRCDKKDNVLCLIQVEFNFVVKTLVVSINTNYTLSASSSSTTITSKDCTSDRNMKDGMAGDATSGKKKLYKNFIYNEFTFTYASSNIGKMDRNVKKYSSDILIYKNIY